MADELFTYRAFLNKVKHHMMNKISIDQLFVEKSQNIKQMEVMYTQAGSLLSFMRKLEVLAQMEEAMIPIDSADFISVRV